MLCSGSSIPEWTLVRSCCSVASHLICLPCPASVCIIEYIERTTCGDLFYYFGFITSELREPNDQWRCDISLVKNVDKLQAIFDSRGCQRFLYSADNSIYITISSRHKYVVFFCIFYLKHKDFESDKKELYNCHQKCFCF